MIPITPRTTAHLGDWCCRYQGTGSVPQPRHIRFSIGVYQISQGMSWPIASPVRWQSFCSAAMHFMMCSYAYGIDPVPGLPEDLSEISDAFPGWDGLLLRLGKVQQQVVYGLNESAASTRAIRFNRDTLSLRLHDLIVACFAIAPATYRERGCFDEMHILTGDLPDRHALKRA
jgi:hypothetical protein